LAFNKADVAPEIKRVVDRHEGSVAISALDGSGIDELLIVVGERLRAMGRVVELTVPYERGDIIAAIHRAGEVVSEDHGPDATRLVARLDAAEIARFVEFRTTA
jgi:GTP-binding protein HflX